MNLSVGLLLLDILKEEPIELGVSLRAGLSPLAFPLKKREELRQRLNP